ncbi:aminotransferase class I/II-fold pyridoxal phosphate-dependent enzyme [Solibacillus sp. CAU 1738]|uniref:pyridoxal phosphate-dependent aminotransferase n=1 Tax=Solibacillus sp. CAU 1738 TaxID=3140363 RepID=UPI003260E943
MQYPAHGANPATLYEKLGLAMPAQVIDLSENVNHFGYPQSFADIWPTLLEKIQYYPHEDAEPLRSKLAFLHKVKTEHIVIGNGAAELLMALSKLYANDKVAILHPSFSEYTRTLQQQNVQIISIIVDDIASYTLPMGEIKEAMRKARAIYFCNPNNPTGVVIQKEQLIEIISFGEQVNCDVIVDEAFMDWTDESHSVINLVETYGHIFVMRSMTKMFSMAGVRLGYCLSQQAATLKSNLPHWNVSGVAIELGLQALEEGVFCEKSRKYAQEMRERITQFLLDNGCIVTQSETNYIAFCLPKYLDATDFYLSLLKEGIVLRHTQNFIGMDGQWFRLALKDEWKMEQFKGKFLNYANNNLSR